MKLGDLGTIFISFFISIGLAAFLLLVYNAMANQAKQPVMTQARSLSIRTAELSEAQASVAAKELPERTGLSYSERVHQTAILTRLQEQRIQALVRGLPDEWVKRQFVAFETAEEKGLALDRSVGWGVGWYHGKEFRWFAYTSPDGWLQMNMSVLMNKQDMFEMAAGRRLDVRNALEYDMPGTATHIAFRDGSTNWIQEFCLKDSSVCNTAGAFEKYFLSHANKAMPEKLLFHISSWFPY